MFRAEKEAITPRAWLEGEPYPWPALDDVAEGSRLVGCYCVTSKQIGVTKNDKPYLRLLLCDRSGEIEGRVWDEAERINEWVAEGAYVGIRGRVENYRGQRQLKVEAIALLEVAPEDLELFLPRSQHDLDELEKQLDALIDSVRDPGLHALLIRLLGRESETGRAFRRAPAAKRNHHAYIGGLLEHTVSIGWVCSALARHYGAALDRDLLVTGALLHDIGKIREIEVASGFPYTDEGKLLGHIVLGIQMVKDAAKEVAELPQERALLVQHLVASHQGKYEWQSPKIPMTLEALLLHYVDDLDAKMHQALALVADAEKGWTGYDPSFGRAFMRHLDAAEEADGSVSAAPGHLTGLEDAVTGSGRVATGSTSDPAPSDPQKPAPEPPDLEAPAPAARRERFAFGRLEPQSKASPEETAAQPKDEPTYVPQPKEEPRHVPQLDVDTLDLFED